MKIIGAIEGLRFVLELNKINMKTLTLSNKEYEEVMLAFSLGRQKLTDHIYKTGLKVSREEIADKLNKAHNLFFLNAKLVEGKEAI